MNLDDVSRQSMEIRSRYHELEKEIHGSEWSLEEDAQDQLPAKIGECVWWLAVLAQRSGYSFEDCVENFLSEKKKELEE